MYKMKILYGNVLRGFTVNPYTHIKGELLWFLHDILILLFSSGTDSPVATRVAKVAEKLINNLK